MILLAIDPGNEESAFVRFDTESQRLMQFGKLANAAIRELVLERFFDHVAVEMIASYGMPVGREVFETCLWIGRLIEACKTSHSLVYRREVKLHLCGQARAKDGNVRQALIDRYGGKERGVGKKATPGPLYGVSADVWQALAIAVTWSDLNARAEAA